MTAAITAPLPDFTNPPVIEVVCGVLFAPITKLLVPHFGLLWERYRPVYPICREVNPLLPVVEQLGDAPAEPSTLEIPPPSSNLVS